MRLVLGLVGGVLLIAGCPESIQRGDGGPVVDAASELDAGPPACTVVDGKVDLLLMVDNSGPMSEEQASFGTELPRLVQALATGDVDGDGVGELPAVQSLQIGVITSDMGTGGYRVPTCVDPDVGDDGILRTTGNTGIGGCMATYPPFLSFRPVDGGDPAAFARDTGCVATAGTGGCGIEQQLEATLKAITPSTSPIRFFAGSPGHADGRNMGFVRPDALLGIVELTDEDDCSASDPELYDASSTTYPGDLNLRCFRHRAAVHPVERYVDGFIAARGSADLLVYSAITGFPARLAAEPTDYDAILSDPEMQEMIDPSMPTRLRPSCNVPGRGLAFAPRRIVRVGQQLEARGASTTMQSICQASFADGIDAIVRTIGARLENRGCR